MRSGKIFFIFYLFLSARHLSCQINQDGVFWGGISVEKKLTKRSALSAYTQFALDENFHELGSFFLDLSVAYRANRNFTLAAGYRVSEFRNLENFYDEAQMVYGQISWTKGFGPYSLSLRSRYQTLYYGTDFSDDHKMHKDISRNKALLRYRINRIHSIYSYMEHFFRWNHKNETSAIRTGVGYTHTFDKYSKLDFFFLDQIKLNTVSRRNDYIFGMTYAYKL